MKHSYSSLTFLVLLSACSAFSQGNIDNSHFSQYYKAPTISISPDPSDYVRELEISPSISISSPSGLEEISISYLDRTYTYHASNANNYSMLVDLRSLVSRSIPLTIKATSSRIGKVSTTNVTYLFDVAGFTDPPTIFVEQSEDALYTTLGSVPISGRVFHNLAKIKSLRISASGFTDRIITASTPYPEELLFNEIFSVTSPGIFTVTITAISASDTEATQTFSWEVFNKPEIIAISPAPTAGSLNTKTTNLTITLRSPKSVNGVWVRDLDEEMLGAGSVAPNSPTSINISIPLNPSSMPMQPVTFKFYAQYTSSDIFTTNLTYVVDHSEILSRPIIRNISPEPGSTIRPTGGNVVRLSAQVEQPDGSKLRVAYVLQQEPRVVLNPYREVEFEEPTSTHTFEENFGLGSLTGNIHFTIFVRDEHDRETQTNITYRIVR